MIKHVGKHGERKIVIVFNEVPDDWTLTGAAIIIFSGLIIWYREKRLLDTRKQVVED